MANRKIKVKSLIFATIAVIVLIVFVYLVIKLFFFDNKKVAEKTPVKVEEIKEVSNSLSSSSSTQLVDYQIFKDESNEIGFNFIIARFKFSDDKEINISLSDFITSESLKLSNTSEYEKKLEDNELYLSSLDVVKEINSTSSPYTCKIFIPFNPKTTSLSVTYKNEEFKFDLDQNIYSLDSLKYTSGSDIKTDDYEFYITNAYLTDSLKLNGEDYSPSAVSIYTYELIINSIADGLKIVDAEFIPNKSSVTNKAKGSEYTSMKCENIIDRDLSKKTDACLFFEVISPEEEASVTYEGTLRLKLSDGSWISMNSEFK